MHETMQKALSDFDRTGSLEDWNNFVTLSELQLRRDMISFIVEHPEEIDEIVKRALRLDRSGNLAECLKEFAHHAREVEL